MRRILWAVLGAAMGLACGGSTSDDGSSAGGASSGGSGALGGSSGTSATGGSSAGGAGGTGGSSTGGVAGSSTGGTGALGGSGGFGGGSPFEKFAGTWLIGWAGNLNHYSWVRLDVDGTASFLDGALLAINAPFWDCSGMGSWIPTAKIDTVGLTFPSSCNLGFESYTFTKIEPATGPFPKGAIDHATLEPLTSTQLVEGFRFPDSQCDAAMTICTDPLL